MLNMALLNTVRPIVLTLEWRTLCALFVHQLVCGAIESVLKLFIFLAFYSKLYFLLNQQMHTTYTIV
jgi:hypothetical protein